MSIEQAIAGKWNFESSENFDEYLKEVGFYFILPGFFFQVGVGFMTRKVAANLKPTLDFVVNGDEWTMTSVSTFKTHITKFKIGVPQDDKTADGRDVCLFFYSVLQLTLGERHLHC